MIWGYYINLIPLLNLSIVMTLLLCSACKRFETSESSPVATSNSEYVFYMKNHLFKIPSSFMQSYGRGKASSKVEGFTIHAVLPNWEGYNSNTREKFQTTGFGDIITVLVESDGRTLEEMETYWYKKTYDSKLYYYSQQGIKPTRISSNPDIIFFDGSFNKYATDEYFYIDREKVKSMLSCAQPNTYSSPGCNITMAYDDNIRIWATFSRKYQSDWIKIFKKTLDELRHFDQKIQQK